MRWTVPLCLVAVLAADARPRPPYGQKFPSSLRVLPAGGGFNTVGSLCDNFSAELTGTKAFCLKSDGTSHSSGMTMTAQGGVGSATRVKCPSGPNCTTVSGRFLDGSDDSYKSADAVAPTGDYSCMMIVTREYNAEGTNSDLITKWDNSGADQQSFAFRNNGLTIADGVTAQSLVITTPALRAYHLLGFTYDFVTSGTSVGRVYLDGVEAVAAKTDFVGPMVAGATTGFIVGDRDGTSAENHLGFVSEAMCTEKVLSAAVVQSMADTTIGKLSASFGETVTFARTSAAACPSSDGQSLTILPAAKPCVTSTGIRIEPAATNLALRSEQFENAAWVDVGTPSITQNNWVSPDGSFTGDAIVDNDGAVAEGKSQSSATTAQVKFTLSCYFQFSGLHPFAIISMTGTGNSAGNATCEVTGTSTTSRKSCSSAAAYGAGITAVTSTITFGQDASATGNVKVWGCQLEAGSATESHATSYIRTEGSTVSRTAETNTFVNPLVTADSSWCMAGLVNNSLTSNVNSRGIIAIGSFAANNTALLRLEDTTKHPQAIIFDNAGGQKIITHSTVLGAGLTHLRFCNAGGTLTMYRDGASVGAVSGAGTGIITTMPGTISVAINGTVSPFEDSVSDLCVGRGALSCAR